MAVCMCSFINVLVYNSHTLTGRIRRHDADIDKKEADIGRKEAVGSVRMSI